MALPIQHATVRPFKADRVVIAVFAFALGRKIAHREGQRQHQVLRLVTGGLGKTQIPR